MKEKSKLQFNNVSHTYVVCDKVLPSVTQLISKYFEFNSSEIHMKAGTELHVTFSELSDGRDPKNDFEKLLKKKIDLFKKNGEVINNNSPLFSAKLNFAGSPDLVIEQKDRIVLIEFKSNRPIMQYAKLQLAAYRILLSENIKKKKKIECYLIFCPDLNVVIKKIDDKEISEASQVFLKILNDYFSNSSLNKQQIENYVNKNFLTNQNNQNKETKK